MGEGKRGFEKQGSIRVVTINLVGSFVNNVPLACIIIRNLQCNSISKKTLLFKCKQCSRTLRRITNQNF